MEEQPLDMVPVGRRRGPQPLERLGAPPRGGERGRQRHNPFLAVASGEGAVSHFTRWGTRILDHILGEVGRNALLVRGVLVSDAAASAVPVPNPRIV